MPSLKERKKYVGGVDGGNGCIYLLPFMSEQVLELNLSNSNSRYIGDKFDLEEGDWKKEDFFDGVVLGKDGMVYGVPCNAHKVLKVDPSSGSTEFVGDDVQTELGWRGAVVAEDGTIYGIPGNATQVLKFDPTTQKTTLIGPVFEGEDKWNAGIIGKDGFLYCIPSTGTHILKFDLQEETGVMVGDDFGSDEGKFRGVAMDANGDIYGIPFVGNKVFKYDVEEETVSWVEYAVEGFVNFCGGKLLPDNTLILVPCNHVNVNKLDLSTGKIESVGTEYKEDFKYADVVHGSDGNLYGVPYMAKQILKVEI